jgi:hypothetical protein
MIPTRIVNAITRLDGHAQTLTTLARLAALLHNIADRINVMPSTTLFFAKIADW